MSRPPQLGPAWLIGLLMAWSRRETRDSGLGFYTVSPMLRDGIPTQARSYEPTGYGGAELDSIGVAVKTLRKMHWLAVMRYLRPWRAEAVERALRDDGETPPISSEWLKLLREALLVLELEMMRKKTLDRRETAIYSAEI